MSETAKTLSERARALPPAERLAMVDNILGSLDETEPALGELWAREAEDSLAAGVAAKSAQFRWMRCCASIRVHERTPARTRAAGAG